MQTKLISKLISPFGGHGASHMAGGLIGGGIGYFISSWRAASEKQALILQLKHLPKKTAELININYQLILKNTCEQLNALDENCKLELKLGDVIKPQFEEFCTIKPVIGNDDAWKVDKLNANIGTQNSETSSGADIEKIIDEYFDSYFGNREEIKSENRAAAVITVTLFHNTSVLLIQLMKSLARLPGKENELRLESFKAIIQDFWKNVTNNSTLMENLNKNFLQKFQEIFIISTTQRQHLATHIEFHYAKLINQLKIEQQDLSIQQMSMFSFRHLQELGHHFLEIVARLFDKEAAVEMTELTTYKIARGILRAETSEQYKSTGAKPFYDDGICKLLKPLAMIPEGLNEMSNQEDGLAFVRYQDLFNEVDVNTLLWKTGNQFNHINTEEQVLIARDIRDIAKLMFICQALEKEFIQSASQYGFQGMIERGEYQAKRFIIQLFYDETMKRMRSFFSKHKYIDQVLKNMGDPKWLTEWKILTQSCDNQYIQTTVLKKDEKNIINQETSITNTILSERIRQQQLHRMQIDYVFEALSDLNIKNTLLTEKNLEEDISYYYDNKSNKIYLFNVCNLLKEYNLLHHFNQDTESHIKNLSSALDVTQKHLEKIQNMIASLSGQCFISSSYSTEEMSLSHISKLNMNAVVYEVKFNNQTAKISSDIYEALRKFQSKWGRCGSVVESGSLLSNPLIPLPQLLHNATNLVTGFVKEDLTLYWNFPKDYDLYQFMKYYQSLCQDFRELKNIATKAGDNAPLQLYLEDFFKALTLIDAVIEHVNLQEEFNKRLAANNKLLKFENSQQKEKINLLSNQVEKLTSSVKNSKQAIKQLEELNHTNAILLEKRQKSIATLHENMLKKLAENVHEVEQMRISFMKQIERINKKLSANQGSAREELQKLEQDVETRTKKILQDFEEFSDIFKDANIQVQKTFEELKKRFSEEQKIIANLKQQLENVLVELEKHRRELEHFKQKKGNMTIVNDFESLFKELEERFAPRLSRFSSYRPVKQDNLLNFIKILLNSQAFLKEDIDQYKTKEDFQVMIKEKLDNSIVINRYHGIFNRSESKGLFSQIIHDFVAGSLVEKLRSGDQIAYHGRYIKLNEEDKLTYENIAMDCPVQPLKN